MNKIINPCTCEVWNHGRANAFAKIEFDETTGRLSISGVVGPMRNGSCKGSAGQCVDEIRSGTPVAEWTDEMLQKFCDIWGRWHLNDMRPTCEHQRELGWDKIATQKVTLYHYRLTSEAQKKKNTAEKAAISALRLGETFTPTEEQTKMATLPYSVCTYQMLDDEHYEPKKSLYAGDQGFEEIKLLGWLGPDKHPDGILSKPCPVCGYKYGTAWNKEEIPQDVIDFLESLPKSKVTPAWV